MVERQLRDRGIRDEGVLEAMSSLPRQLFIPPNLRSNAYSDDALPIALGQSISQPYMVARMSELLELRPGMSVLEVGTGSGYGAAVLAMLGCSVISVERHETLADAARARIEELGLAGAVRIFVGDGSLGRAADAPFDGIVVTAAAPAVPEPLPAQLSDGARLVVPVGTRQRQQLVLVVRRGGEFEKFDCGACIFVPLLGKSGFSENEARRRWPGRRLL